jgi:hypothetical protein
MTEPIAAGEVVSATHTLPGSGRRRRALVISDRPRAIDRHIDYFVGRAGHPTTPWLGATEERRDIAALGEADGHGVDAYRALNAPSDQ